jgi:UDP-N-acetylmuramyl tripeptide synthase
VARDQLYRFGEIDRTPQLIGRTVAAARAGELLNSDDPRIAALADAVGKDVTLAFFGVHPDLADLFPDDDALHKEPAAQALPKAKRPKELLAQLTAYTAEQMTIRTPTGDLSLGLKLKGVYNSLNAAAAVGMAQLFGIDDTSTVIEALERAEPAFGRGEAVAYKDRRVFLQLVKNPSGFRHALRLMDAVSPDAVAVAINDDFADGRDVSWLWDVGFEALQGRPVITSGHRSKDMALRLKYDGVPVSDEKPNLVKALDAAAKQTKPDGTILVFATYTAMLELRKHLTKRRLPA